MKEISELKVKQIRIFGVDRIPFGALRTAVGQKALNELFSWSEIGTNPVTGELVYSAGVFKQKEGLPIVVDRIQISDRRIVLDVACETEQATIIYSTLSEALARFDVGQRWTNGTPIVLVHETSCIVTLDFDWNCLLSNPLLQFTRVLTDKLSSDAASARVVGIRCGIMFSYAVEDHAVREHGITLSNKAFIVEPRANTPLAERRFHTSSPVDSTTHMALIRDLETLMADKPRQKERS